MFNILKIHILKKTKKKEFSDLIKNKRQKMYENTKMLLEKVIIIILIIIQQQKNSNKMMMLTNVRI